MYPLKFVPILKEMIWGGQRIPQMLGMPFDKETSIGESYILSGLPDDNSIVENGFLKGKNLKEIIRQYKADLLGKHIYDKFGKEFPLLIKVIDANDDLSVQVHPNDLQAKEKHNTNGKTEMWYVVDARDDAHLIAGFAQKTNAEEFIKKNKEQEVADLLNVVTTHHGDCFFIPAGRVHSIGKGNLIVEIQQTSNITYRIYDFGRVDKNGKSRELHQEMAMNVIKFDDDETGKVPYEIIPNQSVNLARCPYFTTNIIQVNGNVVKDFQGLDSFVLYVNLGNRVKIMSDGAETHLNELETVLIPASVSKIEILAEKADLLEVYIEMI